MKLLIRACILFFIVTIWHGNEAVAFDGILRANMQNMATLENVRITNDGVIKQPVSFGKNIFDFSVVNGRGNIVEGYRLFSDYAGRDWTCADRRFGDCGVILNYD